MGSPRFELKPLDFKLSIRNMARLNNDTLHEMYCESDFERDAEVEEIEKAVRSVVNQIGQLIGEEDPLFKNRILESGSFYEDLKVEQPDEFDFMVCLEDLSGPGVCRIVDIPNREVKDPGYILVQLDDAAASERWRDYLSRKKNLKSKAMLERFCELVKNALSKVELNPKLSFHGSVELRKIPVTFGMQWSGEKYESLEIYVDMPLCVYIEGWPETCKLDYSGCHPGFSSLEKAKRKGYHLVASSIGESGAPRPCWRLSFSIAEGILLRNIFKSVESVHRAAVMALKVLRKNNEGQLGLFEYDDDDDNFSGFISFVATWVFHSYVIKTTFLQEWFDFPEEEHWTEDKLAERVRAIIGRMKVGLERRDIRSFWVEDYKLFNFKARKPAMTTRCRDKLEEMMSSIET